MKLIRLKKPLKYGIISKKTIRLKLINRFAKERGLKKRTISNYKIIINAYEKYHKVDITTLIKEAEKEEQEKIEWKNRKIKQRLTSFRSHCYNNMTKTSAKSYLTGVKTFYRHFEIELHTLPLYSGDGAVVYDEITYKDIITKDQLLQAYDLSNAVMKAVILFMSSSGLPRWDTCENLTIGHFIDACNEYLTTHTLEAQLKELESIENVVPTFHLRRQKTGKWFFTFCTPEATREILRYLKTRDNLTLDDKLFDIAPYTLNDKFSKINKKLNFGTAGAYGRFVPHMMRKFQATTLTNAKYVWSESEVDAIQGRSKNKIHQAYFKNDERFLKEKYIRCIPDLSFVSTKDFELNKAKEENKRLRNTVESTELLLLEIRETQRQQQELLKKA